MIEENTEREPTQQTQPKGIDPKTGKPFEPVEIPVPTERQIEDLLDRAARPLDQSRGDYADE
jgi:hypothetical protein